MRIGITHRLFLALIVAAALAILCVFFIMQWSIDRGFSQYLNTLEQGRLEQLAGRLEQAYAEHGSWEFLRRDPHYLLMRLTAAQRGDDGGAGMSKNDDQRRDTLPPPPAPAGGPGPRWRFIILDAQRTSVFGDQRDAEATATWNGKRLSVLVRGQTMARPVCLLNRVLLTTRAGRRPFCSWPVCGSNVTATKSPFLGM